MNGLHVRLLAVITAAVCAAPLIGAAMLRPDPRGMGTHEELGLSQCAWFGEYGHPCPTCGWTTALTLASHGRLLDAAYTQPAATATTMLLAMAALAAAYVVAVGQVPAQRYVGRLWRPGWILGAALVMVMLGWAWKLTIA